MTIQFRISVLIPHCYRLIDIEQLPALEEELASLESISKEESIDGDDGEKMLNDEVGAGK